MKQYADFLGRQPPYDALSSADLTRLASALEVEFFRAGTLIVRADEQPLDHLWVVYNGEVEVLDRGRVVDELGAGDTFGHISVLTGLPPALSVRAREDALCLRLPDPRGIIEDPDRLRFSHFGTMITRERLATTSAQHRAAQPVKNLMRRIVWVRGDATLAEAAHKIGESGQSCAVVSGADGIGIVTDRDFRQCVATGVVSPQALVETVATFPALTVPEEFSQAAAFARMVDLGVHHLVVTGALHQPVGVVRAVDFASADIRSPLRIRSLIDSAETLDDLIRASTLLRPSLVELSSNGTPALQVGNLFSAVVEAIMRKLLTLHDVEGQPPRQSWIVLGSMARREPLPHSDVDTAIVWAASDDEGAPDTRPLARRVLDDMERCGLQRCPDGANADAPLFSRSDAEWASAITGWLEDPAKPQALLLSSIVVDSRPLNEVPLGITMTDNLRRRARSLEFVHAFTKESVAIKPPTGFVRGFVVDHRGRHRGQLNLKRGGLLPIASLGRWVSVVTGDSRGGTVDRLRRGAAAGLLTTDEAETLEGAFEQIYEILLHQDVEAIATGAPFTSYLDPKELDSLTRRHLRETFRAIEAVQDKVDSAWQARVRG